MIGRKYFGRRAANDAASEAIARAYIGREAPADATYDIIRHIGIRHFSDFVFVGEADGFKPP